MSGRDLLRKSQGEVAMIGQFRKWIAAVALALACSHEVTAQDAPAPPAPDLPASGAAILAQQQGRIADKYARLEKLMLKLAELDAGENPKRAALLRQAVQQSKDQLTRSQLEAISKLLDQQQLSRAVEGQTAATTQMKALLDLLLSENRADRNKSEQQRIKEYIQEVERLIRLQRDVQGRTEGNDAAERLATEQGKVAERTEALERKIEAEDPNKPAETPPGEMKPGEMKPGEMKPGEMKPGEMKPGEMKPGEMKPGENVPPGEKMPGETQPGEPPMPSDAPPMPGAAESPPQAQNPAQHRLQKAQQKMRDAQKKLEEAKRQDAQQDQEAARRELEQAKADLEEILRQMREEEIGRTLAQLESRFRKMLEMQLRVYDATQRLTATPAENRTREADIEAGKLSGEERKIALEADKAHQLLLEEGSSIAFTETVAELRLDMENVAQRLADVKLDSITLATQEDIIASLNELVAALQQAQKERDEKKQDEQQEDQEEGEPEDDPLVDKIAELKMLRSLQVRINERTKRISKLVTQPDDVVGQATEADVLDSIKKLGDRQRKLQEMTRDITLGKNQ